MKCQRCKTDLVLRSGKHGKFYACPKSNPSDNHGTVSVGQPAYNYEFHSTNFCLDTEIQKQMMPYIGRMTDLDLFVEGGSLAAEDDPDHWMNVRLY